MSSANSSSEDAPGPLVFSCCKCKTIIGDSFSLYSSNQEMNTITLSASSNIQRTKDIYTSTDKYDQGSSFFMFVCSVCQQPLGKYYVTTNNDIDSLREKFTFDIDAITSYELGKAQHGKPLDAASRVGSDKQSQQNQELQMEIIKMQAVIINLSERVTALETQNGSSNVESERSKGVRSELGARTASTAAIEDRTLSSAQKTKR